ncbi:MAG TPA: class I SAM-dependent methyltransferase [Methylomirabilota bacterium]|nr:class I SAM-dependent methyltransferase [Methylomirabilota bacterium]
MDAEAFRRFERETHDRLAATYCDFFADDTRGMIEPLLDGARVRAGARVLDVACGPGHVAAAAAARGARVLAVDLSPEMVALARRSHPGLDARQGDAEALPFDDARFDAVVCNFGLGHFPRPETAVRELARVLVPGGRLALAWWDVPARSRANGALLDAVAAVGAPPPADVPPGPPAFQFSEDAALAALLRAAGLADVAVTTHTWTHRAPSVDMWWHGGLGGMARAASAIRGQSADVQRRIRAEFERLAAAYAVDGGYDIPNSAKLGVGTTR